MQNRLFRELIHDTGSSVACFLVSISEVVLGDIVAALIGQVEIKQDAGAFSDLTSNSHHSQVDIVAVDWIPLVVEHYDTL